jgi:hypothetical protein
MFMNLGKLLGLGKSFFAGGQSAAYRLNKRVYLPKFNAEKNPFTPKAPIADLADAPAAPKVEKQVSVPVAVRTQTILVPSVAKPARPGWTAKLNPFRAPEPVAPKQPVAVQPELSLDTVKVVHNDLADADVEVVPVKSRAVEPAAPVLPPARQAWEYLGESLLKSS